ncbi:hypothetical protein JR316_0006363 [Psilocybe cubensis]|uniref:Uncharacterized protein n=1 Tax=Psilocybe cubensis TaxID=181762 RepID=A0ACB8H1F6_PSICU|nr:hypothetical protein JR316_0006363 [Psilocybe cubensis]KAH9481833.1 hypothetical protein JR316_0006363 [Psilocybe cubensis]
MVAGTYAGGMVAAEIVDYSMMSTAEVEAIQNSSGEKGGEASALGARAFDDLTDLENEEFIVSNGLIFHL